MKRTLTAILIGALPIALLAVVARYFGPANDEPKVQFVQGVVIGVGALWGLAAGIFRRSLLRSLVGLNAGAACGFAFFKCMDEVNGGFGVVVLFVAIAGGVLGSVINVRKAEVLPSLARGFVAGAATFAAVALTVRFISQYFTTDLLGWLVMCLVPFGGGMALFLALLGHEPANQMAPKIQSSAAPAPAVVP